jgi:hypothetical protein
MVFVATDRPRLGKVRTRSARVPINGGLIQRFRPTEPQPTIGGFFPLAAAPGDAVTITGQNFDRLVPAFPGGLAPATWVKFGHFFDGIARADWQFVSSGELRATVPADALSGPIMLTRMRRGQWPWDDDEWIVIAQSAQSFTVLPEAPTGLRVAALGSNAVRLDWSYAGSSHTGFVINYREGAGNWTQLPTSVPPDRRFLYLWEASPATMYAFTVAAVKGVILSNLSNVATATTGPGARVTIQLGAEPSPFQDAGPVTEIVSLRGYVDNNANGTLDGAPSTSSGAFFPRWVPPLGSPGAGFPQQGNRFLPGSNAVALVTFRTGMGRPVQYAAIPLTLSAVADNAPVTQGPMAAGDYEVYGSAAARILIQQQAPAQVVIQPLSGIVRGDVTAALEFEVPNPEPTEPGTINRATVSFFFDLALEPEINFSA